MTNKPKAIFSWSGGKDSAYCLCEVLAEGSYEVTGLLTSLNANFKRVSMHGVREELLDAQAAAIGIPLLKVWVKDSSNETYEREMAEILLKAKSAGVEYVIYGDIFLEDLRAYREKKLEEVGLKAVFPLWKKDTKKLVEDFVALQFKTLLCCTNDGYLGEAWVGKNIDASFVEALPAGVDACGENGEYHTFCYAGPIYKNEIGFVAGEKIYRPLEIKMNDASVCTSGSTTRGFWFIDLLPEVHRLAGE